jgi:hypothetical protein
MRRFLVSSTQGMLLAAAHCERTRTVVLTQVQGNPAFLSPENERLINKLRQDLEIVLEEQEALQQNIGDFLSAMQMQIKEEDAILLEQKRRELPLEQAVSPQAQPAAAASSNPMALRNGDFGLFGRPGSSFSPFNAGLGRRSSRPSSPIELSTGGASGNAVVYVLPQLAPGVGIVLAKGLANGASGDGDTTAYRLRYSTGGLMVQYAGFSTNNIAAGTANTVARAATGGYDAETASVGTGWTTNFSTGLASTVTTTQEATAANSKAGGTALGITYNFGMATVSYGTFTAKSGGDADQKAKATIMGVSMPFGATTVGITSSSAQRTNAAATTVKASGYRGKVSYALSKRTSVYAAYGAEKVEATTLANKQTAFGLTHSF